MRSVAFCAVKVYLYNTGTLNQPGAILRPLKGCFVYADSIIWQGSDRKR